MSLNLKNGFLIEAAGLILAFSYLGTTKFPFSYTFSKESLKQVDDIMVGVLDRFKA